MALEASWDQRLFTPKSFLLPSHLENHQSSWDQCLSAPKSFSLLSHFQNQSLSKRSRQPAGRQGFSTCITILGERKNKAGHIWAQHLLNLPCWKPDSSLKCLRICLQKLVSEPNLTFAHI